MRHLSDAKGLMTLYKAPVSQHHFFLDKEQRRATASFIILVARDIIS